KYPAKLLPIERPRSLQRKHAPRLTRCSNPLDEIDLEDVTATRTVQFGKARPRVFLIDRPARMLAGIHAIKLAVPHRDVVHVAGAGHEIHDLQHLAGARVILHQARNIALIADHFRILGAADLPDDAGVRTDAVQPPDLMRHREDEFGLPALGIDADDGFHAIGIKPQLPVFPARAMAGAAILLRPKGKLAMADLLAVHVGL